MSVLVLQCTGRVSLHLPKVPNFFESFVASSRQELSYIFLE